MHVAVLAAGDAAAAAHVVGEVAVRGHAADEVGAEVAVQDAHPVAGPEHERRADRDRLLAAAVVEAAGDLALAIERDRALLGGAHHRHVPEQVARGPRGSTAARAAAPRPARRARQHSPSRVRSTVRGQARLRRRHRMASSLLRPSCLAGRFGISSRPAWPFRRFGISSTAPTDDGCSGFRPRSLCLDPSELLVRANRYSHCIPDRRRFNPDPPRRVGGSSAASSGWRARARGCRSRASDRPSRRGRGTPPGSRRSAACPPPACPRGGR